MFTYLPSNILSTESDVNIRLAKVWTAIDKLALNWKIDKIKRDFFKGVAVAILLYGGTSWTLRKRIQKDNMKTTQECYMLFGTNP